MDVKDRIRHAVEPILTKEQKLRFREYYPEKIYRVERNIGLVVAGTQLCMIVIFFFLKGDFVMEGDGRFYLYLYLYLFLVTVFLIPVYMNLVKRKKYAVLVWLRRSYVFAMCVWVMGITVLDQIHGSGLGVFCYLIPTMAAVLLMSPAESFVIFGGQWMILLMILTMMNINADDLFSSIVNSFFVTVLAVFISMRYYRSMEVEFRDRDIIESQYKEIEKVNEKLSVMVNTDQLTGLNNRRYLSEVIYHKFEEYKKQGCFMEMLMLDIDFFKQYNDTYGHVQGDACLREISAIIRECISQENVVVIRYGGEEFLLMHCLPEECHCLGENGGGNSLADCIQDRLRQAGIPRNDTVQDHVTISIGIWRGRLQQSDNMEKLISHADEALYRAKNAGRDCIQYY